MKKIFLLIAAAAMLNGCVSHQRSEVVNAIPGVVFQNLDGVETIKSYSVEKQTGSTSKDALKTCVLRNITNNQVQLTDASKSFTDDATGKYHNIQTSSNVQGGAVIQTETSKGIIFSGTGEYTISVLKIKKTVRFTGEITNNENKATFIFSNIQQAQNDSGLMANDGFSPVGSWDSVNPERVIHVLDEKADAISSCLSHF